MPNPNTAIFPNAIPSDYNLTVASDSSVAILTTTIGSTTTVIPVSQVYNTPCIVSIDNELIYAQNSSGSTYTNVTRGFNNTVATSHNSGTNVYGYIFSYSLNQMAAEIKAICSALGRNLTNVIPAAKGTFSSASTINVVHNLNTTAVFFRIVDTSGNELPYASSQIVDVNNISITLDVATSGTVYVFGSKAPSVVTVNGVSPTAPGNLVYGSPQFTSQLTASFNHQLSTNNILYQMYNSTNNAIINPGNLSVVDTNNVVGVFSTPQSGRVVICSDASAISQTLTATTNITINHGFGTQNIFVSIFDTNNQVIGAQAINIVDNNNILVTFNSATSGRIVIMQDPQFVYTITSTASSYSINHGLNSQNLCFQVWLSGVAVEPLGMQIVDNNNVTVTFGATQSAGKILFKG